MAGEMFEVEFRNLNFEKVLKYLEKLSFKPLMISVGSSFIVASAGSLFVGHLLIPDPEKIPSGKKRKQAVGKPLANQNITLDREKEKIILDRNIFNSTGELGDAPKKSETTTRQRPANGEAVKTDLPIKLKGIIFAGDIYNGLATIENTQRRRTNSFMVGDVVLKDARLVEIYEDRVILKRNSRLEFLELEKHELMRSRRSKKSKGKKRGGSGVIAPIAQGPPPSAFKEEGFEREGNEIVLSSQYRENLLSPQNMTKILQDAKAEPNMVGGEVRGFRLTRIRENSIYQKAGFQNGDIIEEINGIPLRDAAGAIRLLQQLRGEKEIEVRLNRGGRSSAMNVVVQ